MNRPDLMNVLKRCEPAAASKAPLAAFNSVFFDGVRAATYDGELAVVAACDFELAGGVEFKPLLVWLSGCKGATVSASVADEVVTFVCGRAKLRLPLLDQSLMVFTPPTAKGVTVRHEDLDACLRQCARTMNADDVDGKLSGVTVSSSGGSVEMFSTNMHSLSAVKMSGCDCDDGSTVLPARFVKSVLSTRTPTSAEQALVFGDSFAYFCQDHADLFSRTFAGSDVDAYRGVIKESLDRIEHDKHTAFGVDINHALTSVANVSKTVGEDQCKLTVSDNELTIQLSGGSRCVSEQSVAMDHPDIEAHFSAPKLVQASADADRVAIGDGVFAAWNDRGVSLLAGMAAE
tara:strand:- start:7715 stop:8752 length:1038 start_codon:yes stop_codon:yes gene_type:complete